MSIIRPGGPEELASVLRGCAESRRAIFLHGARTKDRMAGPLPPADVEVSTTAMDRLLEYEPRDLTISVQAGMRWSELVSLLAKNGQTIPLDPPFSAGATIGGVIASNGSGPRRRLYGSARDMVIGMKFATLEGKIVQSGGMVVKNVAGLDMAKLMIGSFGTLAAIVSVNFKVLPLPEASRTFLAGFPSVEDALTERDRILASALQPAAVDLLNPAASARIGLQERWTMLVQAFAARAVLGRYREELRSADELEGDNEDRLWLKVREFTPAYLAANPDAVVLRVSTTLTGIASVMRTAVGPAVARAGTGVVYLYGGPGSTLNGFRGAVEFAPEQSKKQLDLWPDAGSGLGVMERIKNMFDPERLLNRGRLYGRI